MRLGLPAFKMLGASWAAYRAIIDRLDAGDTAPRLGDLRDLVSGAKPITLVTATDGNHGRALARMAQMVGVEARVFVPDAVSRIAIDQIRKEGAEVVVLPQDYDATVQVAAADAADDDGAILVQDTAWDGYEEIPQWIVDGYSTLFREIDTQLVQQGAEAANVVTVPTGVGSLLQAAVQFHRSGHRGQASLVAVEPASASCITTSLQRGEPISVQTGRTNMAGLNCGTPSSIAWPFLAHGIDTSVCVTDEQAQRASDDLGGFGISSGPCGGAALAGLRALRGVPFEIEWRDQQLGSTGATSVVLLNTEGAAPPG